MGYSGSPDGAGWQSLPLAAGWEQFDNSAVYLPQYKKSGDAVFVKGAARTNVANSSGGYILVSQLPASIAPNYLSTLTYVGSSNGAVTPILDSARLLIAGPLPINWVIWLTLCYAV